MATEMLTSELVKALPATSRREFVQAVREAREASGLGRLRMEQQAGSELADHLAGVLGAMPPRRRAWLQGCALGLYIRSMMRGQCPPLRPVSLPGTFEN